ncbi:MAG: hypothetical protein KBS63_01505 [Clostridiales bacterium]|nr:hypothetical protein [Candidatus Crickella caballi]
MKKKYYNILLANLGLSIYIIADYVQNVSAKRICGGTIFVAFIIIFLLSLKNDTEREGVPKHKIIICKIAVIILTCLLIGISFLINNPMTREVMIVIVGVLLFIPCSLLADKYYKEDD